MSFTTAMLVGSSSVESVKIAGFAQRPAWPRISLLFNVLLAVAVIAALGKARNTMITKLQHDSSPTRSLLDGTRRLLDADNFTTNSCPMVINNGASRTLRVALGFYGLVRHPCPEVNLARVFYEPLSRVEKFSFELDTFMAINILTSPEKSTRPRYEQAHYEPVSQAEFMKFNPCHISLMDQEVVDHATLNVLGATCRKYGDAWADKSCRTTHNFLAALHAERRVGHLIRAHEKNVKAMYDIIVVARADVLFTSSIPHALYAAVAARAAARKSVIVTPSWGTWDLPGGRRGANDKFAIGTREAVLSYLERLEQATAFCDENQTRLHSETFTMWRIKAMNATYATEHMTEDRLMFRRVRGNGELRKELYECPVAERSCRLHWLKECTVEEVAEVGVCDAQ
jgi:hypothetical protein